MRSKSVRQLTVQCAAFFSLLSCYPELQVDPATGKPDLDSLQEQIVPWVAASAAVDAVGRLTEAKLHIFISQVAECSSPTPCSDLQIQLREIKSATEIGPVILRVDVPSTAFNLPLHIPEGQYLAELWDNRLLIKLSSVRAAIEGHDVHIALNVPCRR